MVCSCHSIYKFHDLFRNNVKTSDVRQAIIAYTGKSANDKEVQDLIRQVTISFHNTYVSFTTLTWILNGTFHEGFYIWIKDIKKTFKQCIVFGEQNCLF